MFLENKIIYWTGKKGIMIIIDYIDLYNFPTTFKE